MLIDDLTFTPQVQLSVDDQTERLQALPIHSDDFFLSTSSLFVGGIDRPQILPEGAANNFVGCLKAVKYEADGYNHPLQQTRTITVLFSLYLPLLSMAEEKSRFVQVKGNLRFECLPELGDPHPPITFASRDDSYLVSIWCVILSAIRSRGFYFDLKPSRAY